MRLVADEAPIDGLRLNRDAALSRYRRPRDYDMEHIIIACKWPSDIGVVEKASTPVKLTTRSQIDVEELAFFRVKW